MGYNIGYSGPQVDKMLQKAYTTTIVNNGWERLDSTSENPYDVNSLVTPGNYTISYWENGPDDMTSGLRNGQLNISITKDNSDNTIYQTVYYNDKIYIRTKKAIESMADCVWVKRQQLTDFDAVGINPPANPEDNYVFGVYDEITDSIHFEIYNETTGEWMKIQPSGLALKSIYDPQGIEQDLYTFINDKVEEADLSTAEQRYDEHINQQDSGVPIHTTEAEKAQWLGSVDNDDIDAALAEFKSDMIDLADSKVTEKSTYINGTLTTNITKAENDINTHINNSDIHITNDQTTVFNNKAAGNHTHLNDGTVKVSTSNLTGVVDIKRLPNDVIEKNVELGYESGLGGLSNSYVQNGDSIRIRDKDNPSSWFVVDDRKFSKYEKGFFNTISDASDICYGDGKFIAVSLDSNVCEYSTDGINWETANMPTVANWNHICYGNGLFISTTDQSGIIGYSSDGINWNKTDIIDGGYTDLCYGDFGFVIIGQKCMHSTDGINWNEVTIGNEQKWSSICYGNGKYVAVSSTAPKVAISTNGTTWTVSTVHNTERGYSSICYGNGKYVAVNESSGLIKSEDGINWLVGDTNIYMTLSFREICFCNGTFVVASNDMATMVRGFTFSFDANTWFVFGLDRDGTNYIEKQICAGNGITVAVGNGNIVSVFTPMDPSAIVRYADPLPKLTWSNIQNKPTDPSYYGIDTYSSAEIYEKYDDTENELNAAKTEIETLDIPKDINTTEIRNSYKASYERALALNKKLDEVLMKLGVNPQQILDIMSAYSLRSIDYVSSTIDTNEIIGTKTKIINYSMGGSVPSSVNVPTADTVSFNKLESEFIGKSYKLDDTYTEGSIIDNDNTYYEFSGYKASTQFTKLVESDNDAFINTNPDDYTCAPHIELASENEGESNQIAHSEA